MAVAGSAAAVVFVVVVVVVVVEVFWLFVIVAVATEGDSGLTATVSRGTQQLLEGDRVCGARRDCAALFVVLLHVRLYHRRR